MNRYMTFPLLVAVFALASCSPPSEITAPTLPTTDARFAAVAMPDQFAAEAAEAILKSGGNAVDAAIATGFVLAVTYPEAGNIGGGGFMLIRMQGKSSFLDYRETAPSAASRDMYLGVDGQVDARASLVGIRAVGVPGTVAGLWAAHQRFGSKTWKELLQPSISLARDGFIVPEKLAKLAEETSVWFAGETNSDNMYASLVAGKLYRQPELAATLQRIAESGPEDFYRGETADLIQRQVQKDGGLVSAADLAGYEAIWREPLISKWRDFEVVAAPPPSSGGFAVIQLLKMKDAIGPEFTGLAHNSPQYVHLIAEMEKRVFADRAEYFGDPDFVDVPIDELIADDYTNKRAKEVNTETISTLQSAVPGLEPPHTTHYSIVDADGNAVSNTYTLNWEFGSGILVEGGGFLLNNEMDDFSVKPGVPNIYGVVGNVANEIEPGKRMLSSMAPTILLRDGQVEMVIGTPGGSTIFTTVFQGIVNVLDFGMTPAQAVSAGRFHHQLLPPDLVTYSPAYPLSDETILKLTERGYRVEPHSWEFGNLQLIQRVDGQWIGASDPRGRGQSRTFEVTKASSKVRVPQ